MGVDYVSELTAFQEVLRTSRDFIRLNFFQEVHQVAFNYKDYFIEDPIGLYKQTELEPTTMEGYTYLRTDTTEEVSWDISDVDKHSDTNIIRADTRQVVIPKELLIHKDMIFKTEPIVPVNITRYLIATVKMMLVSTNPYRDIVPHWYNDYPFGYLTEEGTRYFTEEEDLEGKFENILTPVYDFIMKEPVYIYRVELNPPFLTLVRTIDIRAWRYEIERC